MGNSQIKKIIHKELEDVEKSNEPLTEEQRKYTTTLLYAYYNKDKKINAWRHKIEVIAKQIERIENRQLEYADLYSSPSFGDNIQTGRKCGSMVEMALILEERDKQRRIENLMEEIKSLRNDIEEMEQFTAIVDYFINSLELNELDLKILEMKFRDRKTEMVIGYEVETDQSNVNKRAKKIVERIYRWHLKSSSEG